MNFNPKFIPYIAGGAVVILVLAVGGYFYFKSNTPALAQAEVKKLVAEVGKLMDLPAGEVPTIATVTDIEKLKAQPFFQKAKNGDKVLIYANAKKAILYNPQTKKIIDVAPINTGTSSAQLVSAKIVLRNGTQTIGLASKFESEVKKTLPDINIVGKDNAIKDDYFKTLVIVLNDAFKDIAAGLVSKLNASASALPAGESSPKDADILIILGQDKI